MTVETKKRLERFYQKYAPEKMSNLEKILQAYSGKEETLFLELVKKYGPEPADVNASEWRTRVTRIYQHYAPEKIANVDQVMEHYRGREDAAIDDLVKKYGPEPQSAVGIAAPKNMFEKRLEAFYAKYAPEKLANVSQLLEKFKGTEEAMMQELVKKYGPEPLPSSAESLEFKKRLQLYFQRCIPEKVGQVDAFAEKYSGREEELMRSLTLKFGPEQLEFLPEQESDKFLARVERLLRKYSPSRATSAKSLVASYKGKEEELIAALVKKLGPEEQATAQESELSIRVRNLVGKYAPEKIGQCSQLLAKYSGREQELINALVKKYDPEANEPNSTSSSQQVQLRSLNSLAQTEVLFRSCEDLLRFCTGERGLAQVRERFLLSTDDNFRVERIMLLASCCERMESLSKGADEISTLNAITPGHEWTNFPSFLTQLPTLESQSILEATVSRAFALRDILKNADQQVMQLFDENLKELQKITQWEIQDRDRALLLATERCNHRNQVIARAIEMISSIETSTRVDLWKLQDVEVLGILMWFRERRREISTSFDVAPLSDVQQRFDRWRALVDDSAKSGYHASNPTGSHGRHLTSKFHPPSSSSLSSPRKSRRVN
jgi:hypothetical protein